MDQPGKVANPARGQLNRENEHSPVPVRSRELSAQVVGVDSCKSCIPANTDAYISRPGRNG